MSKLRVGDIEIDDGAVRFSNRERLLGAAIATPPQPMHRFLGVLVTLQALPMPARAIGWVGSAVTIAGLALAAWNEAWLDPIGAILRGGVLVPLGAGLMGAALLKRSLERGTLRVDRLALGDGADAMVRTVRPLLTRPLRHQTVEWLEARTGWPESTVVSLLGLMREHGELTEEFDDESGNFYYHLARRESRDLDSRRDTIYQGKSL